MLGIKELSPMGRRSLNLWDELYLVYHSNGKQGSNGGRRLSKVKRSLCPTQAPLALYPPGFLLRNTENIPSLHASLNRVAFLSPTMHMQG